MRDLSVLIPSRQEPFLRHTIEDVLAAIEADTEIIVVADGALPVEPINDHPRVKLILLPKAIGQRAATNLAARQSRAKYIMKLDAHCRVDKGFDAKLIADCQPDRMLIPTMFNLHVFDWACDACGNRTYQGPVPVKCLKCGESRGFTQVMVWEPRLNRRTESYRYDNTLHFAYWRELMKQPAIKAQGEIHDTMSFLGACQFMERDYFWKLGGCDTRHGGEAGWGQWSTEWSNKVWLSGGRVAVTQRTWFSHLFRTQGPGFSFPYKMSGNDQENARKYSRNIWLNNKWEGQKRPLASLLEQFWPIPGWQEEDLDRAKAAARSFLSNGAPPVTQPAIVEPVKVVIAPTVATQRAGIVYYSDALLADPIMEACQRQLARAVGDIPIISVSLGKAINFGDNIIIHRARGAKSLFMQIIAGLERSTADYVYLCEHDCLYPPEHFTFIPPRDDVYYYNVSLVRVSAATGRAVTYQSKQLSGLCANRLLLLEHYYRRLAKMALTVRQVRGEGRELPPKWPDGHSRFSLWEPGGNSRPGHEIDHYGSDVWHSSVPYIDVRDHGSNFSRTKWKLSQFWDKSTCIGWRELAKGELIQGWPTSPVGRFNEFLIDLAAVPDKKTVALSRQIV